MTPPEGETQADSIHSILKIRRHYNQWVADQTLEDFALRFTAHKARHMSIAVVGKTALGATAFLALESIAAAVTLSYGFENTVIAMLVVCAIFFITGFPISYYCARYGVDIDLLTRGAGFGYLGSTLTSLIYASFTFIFFAIEAAILSSALHLLFGIPMPIAYVICAVAVIPIVMKGITAISRFQVGTQTLWLVLQIAALLVVLANEWTQLSAWMEFSPVQQSPQQGFDWVLFGAAASVFFALIAQIGEQADYLRFMPEKTSENRKQWWFWVILSGPGWVSVGLVKMLLGSFLAYVAIQQGVSFVDAADPTRMYQRAFSYVVQSDQLALVLAALMVIISQMKINVTNAYAGSIAWSNFFSRLTHSHPGRVVWLVFNVALALLLMELGIHKVLESILSVFAFVAVSWLACLSADLLINKPLGFSPKHIEFKRGHLYDINPVGAISMIVATALGLFSYLGVFGDDLKTFGHFVSLTAAYSLMPALAWLTKGRYYLAREPEPHSSHEPGHEVTCSICQNAFEQEDVLFCPAYQQTICSLCCSLDARCLDQCKPDPRAQSGLIQWLTQTLPASVVSHLWGRSGQFVAWFLVVNTLLGSLLALVYRHIQVETGADQPILASGLWTLFFALMIVTGVVTWLFLLSHESRVQAQQESNRQTKKLIREVEAHRETDSALQQAKDLAENANAAKSRYMSGISHELRTPLQSILGYTQLLSDRADTPLAHQQPLDTIHRSGQYLADLIEGLLDVSKIEAGRLDLHITQVAFPDLVHQVGMMFQMQAEAKGIALNINVHDTLPKWVNTDEKRLRQILINLLSNAIKYTPQGQVDFDVRYRSQVAEFTVRDTGVGIAREEHERIFSPFERVQNEYAQNVPGTGLGLTIVKLLVEILGGDLQFTSVVGEGSEFKVVLMLPWVHGDVPEHSPQSVITGIAGTAPTILVVDDDAIVRGMLTDLLAPIGFQVVEVINAKQCLDRLPEVSPDLLIIDVSMPGMNGFELVQAIRQLKASMPIFMLSANAQIPDKNEARELGYDEYLVKPIQNFNLLDKIAKHLKLTWIMRDGVHPPLAENRTRVSKITLPDHPLTHELLGSADIGFKRGALQALQGLIDAKLVDHAERVELKQSIQSLQFKHLMSIIEVETNAGQK